MLHNTNLSPLKLDDSRYGSTEPYDDNPVIKELVFDLKNDYEERDCIDVNSEKHIFVLLRIKKHLGK